MKKLSLTLLTLLTLGANAQNVTIPDANFKSYLVGNANINLNHDTEIQINEAISYTGTIKCSNKNISDLTGIESFKLLTKLDCSNNDLVSLNTSSNLALTSILCDNNKITNLDFSSNVILKQLWCGQNKLVTLNVSSNSFLNELWCHNNLLTNLDVTSNVNLKNLYCNFNQLGTLDISNNTSLIGLTCSHNKLTSLDISSNTALTSILCNNNKITSLDVSSNTNLVQLNCNHNQLGTLNVSSNTNLLELYCNINELLNLDVSSNTKLKKIHCQFNLITNLDISSNTVLKELYVQNNQLVTLNIANSNNVNFSVFDATDNLNLVCIQIDGGGFTPPTNNWYKDVAANYNENCTLGLQEDLDKQHLGFYPNPVSETLYFDKILSNIFIYSAQGKLMGEYSSLNHLDISNYSAGIYLIKSDNLQSQFVVK